MGELAHLLYPVIVLTAVLLMDLSLLNTVIISTIVSLISVLSAIVISMVYCPAMRSETIIGLSPVMVIG